MRSDVRNKTESELRREETCTGVVYKIFDGDGNRSKTSGCGLTVARLIKI